MNMAAQKTFPQQELPAYLSSIMDAQREDFPGQKDFIQSQEWDETPPGDFIFFARSSDVSQNRKIPELMRMFPNMKLGSSVFFESFTSPHKANEVNELTCTYVYQYSFSSGYQLVPKTSKVPTARL